MEDKKESVVCPVCGGDDIQHENARMRCLHCGARWHNDRRKPCPRCEALTAERDAEIGDARLKRLSDFEAANARDLANRYQQERDADRAELARLKAMVEASGSKPAEDMLVRLAGLIALSQMQVTAAEELERWRKAMEG